jgi:hypothetical protein
LRSDSDFLKDILLITPPFTQLNTPYPATAYIKGFLNTKGIDSYQMDLGIEVILKLFSKNSLIELFDQASESKKHFSENTQRILALRHQYEATIDEVILFLQGKNQTFARQLCSENFLPRASRFNLLDDMDWAFGNMGMQDKAKHLSTLFLEDLSDFIVECIDDNFGFSRYAERLGRSANSFDELQDALSSQLSYIDQLTIELLNDKLIALHPKLVCFSVPFPGNLFSAFRCAQHIKANFPEIKTAMGGGFPNTELRSLKELRVFDYFDFITLDDGELPLELLVKHVFEKTELEQHAFKRTYYRLNDEVIYQNNASQADYKQSHVGTPDYSDLLLDQYISVIEIANPMHSLWSDGRWNKLTMAHGCYWGKCTFCDVSLDYIKIYEPIAAKQIVDRMETMIDQTGERGFHFVDEAAPPALMKEVAIEILKRRLVVTWWTNIRFEKSFTADLCKLLKASGCIAVSGGLEVASDRLLTLIKKGVTVAQVAKVTDHFTQAGIMVHAYLMYGYPTQTEQETIDSLEMVRQLFELGVIQSGFWHQFALTAHSPVGLNPEEFGIIPQQNEITFANNDVAFKDKTGIDHGKFSFGLKKALFNYMHGICFEYPLQEWFEFKVPKTTIKRQYIASCLEEEVSFSIKPTARVIWIGNTPTTEIHIKNKKGREISQLKLTVHTNEAQATVIFPEKAGNWLIEQFKTVSAQSAKPTSMQAFKEAFETETQEDFEPFWFSKPMMEISELGLLVV